MSKNINKESDSEHFAMMGALQRRNDVRIKQGFQIADQQPDLIAENKPNAESKDNEDQDCQGNFGFAHSQEMPPARDRGNNPWMIAKHRGRAQS